MQNQPDLTRWSGEGTLTQTLVERLRGVEAIAFLRVEDAPASRSDADYNFISNEVFVAFTAHVDSERQWRFGVLPMTTRVSVPAMSLADLERVLTDTSDIGPPDYSDGRMLQYLHSERIVPPYQTRGYKLVELVRIYEIQPE